MTAQALSECALPAHPEPEATSDDLVVETTRLLEQVCRRDTSCEDRGRARTRVIELNLPFATRIARRFAHRGEPAEDLAQVAALGLIKAVDGFDTGKGKPFHGYAMPTILGELKRHFRDKGWDVRVSRQLQERHLSLNQVRAWLAQRLHRSPTTRELATELGLTEQEVLDGLAAGSAYDVESLNRRVSFEADACERQDLLGQHDPGFQAVCDRITLRSLIHRLPRRERQILGWYFVDNLTQAQIAAELGMSQMNVSRLLAQGLDQLRGYLRGDECTDRADVEDAGARMSTYAADRDTAVVCVRGDVDERGAVRLRGALVDAAMRSRPRRMIVDLRHARLVCPAAVRALVEGHRACGHIGASLVAVNVPDQQYAMLRRLGVTSLLPCQPRRGVDTHHPAHPAAPARRGGVADRVPARVSYPSRGSHPRAGAPRSAPVGAPTRSRPDTPRPARVLRCTGAAYVSVAPVDATSPGLDRSPPGSPVRARAAQPRRPRAP